MDIKICDVAGFGGRPATTIIGAAQYTKVLLVGDDGKETVLFTGSEFSEEDHAKATKGSPIK